MSSATVLIVDDDFDVRENVKMVLENEGYKTLEARNGLHALRLLPTLGDRGLPGLIVLDIMMDEMGGKEFLEVLHKDHRDDGWANIPVVIMSAASSGNLNDFAPSQPKLRKPLDLDVLLALVDKTCRRDAS